MKEFEVGDSIVIGHGPFMTLEATLRQVTGPAKGRGTVSMFGREIEVEFEVEPGGSIAATVDRSEIIARYASAERHYGVVGHIVAGDDAGRYIRIDRCEDLPTTPGEQEDLEDAEELAGGVMIRIADDPGMQVNCTGEWVEDWAGVEESFTRHSRSVDWTDSNS